MPWETDPTLTLISGEMASLYIFKVTYYWFEQLFYMMA